MLERLEQAYNSTVDAGTNLSNQVIDHVKSNWKTVTNQDAPTSDRLLAGTILLGEGLMLGAGAYTVGKFAFNRATANNIYPAERMSVKAFSDLSHASTRPAGFHYRAFYDDMNAAVGTRLRSSEQAASQAWGSLANVAWLHKNHPPILHTFRRSGELVADMAKDGDYLKWYMSSRHGQVPRWIQRSMAEKGWTPKIID